MFDATHPARPKGKEDTPWLVEDATGRFLSKQEVGLVQRLPSILGRLDSCS